MLKEPIKFEPILKEKIWGGKKLIALLNKKSNKKNIGESWEISSVDQDVSIVSLGTEKGNTLIDLIDKYKGDLVGRKVYKQFGNQFPLLIKFIDAKTALSIQLHPNDELAKKRHQSFGKTEMWYVMQADKNAELIVGFKKKVSKDEYQTYLKNKTLLNILNADKVKKGDTYFIPTGSVHAIGAGVLLAEIQQTSDITYRIYDWDRKDDDGNYRELHTENALDALDFKVKNNYKTNYSKEKNKSKRLINCPFFKTNIIVLQGEIVKNHYKKDSFIVYMCVEGNVTLKYNKNKIINLKMGETILIPNSLNRFRIFAAEKSELLEIYI